MKRFVEVESYRMLQATTLSETVFSDWGVMFRHHFVVGIEIKGEIVGAVAFRRDVPNLSNHIELLEVAKPYQKHGYGAMLLAIVMIDAFRQPGLDGFVGLTTKTTSIKNFYLHLGGDMIGQQVIFQSSVSQNVINQYLPERSRIEWTTNK